MLLFSKHYNTLQDFTNKLYNNSTTFDKTLQKFTKLYNIHKQTFTNNFHIFPKTTKTVHKSTHFYHTFFCTLLHKALEHLASTYTTLQHSTTLLQIFTTKIYNTSRITRNSTKLTTFYTT